MSASEAGLAAIQTVQLLLQAFHTMVQPTAWRFNTCVPNNGSKTDYIIIGAGSAGSVIANRLSANIDNDVMLFEAGGLSPWEADMAGLFTVIPSTPYDYNFTSVNDGYTAQNLQGGHVGLTQGKMLGGSGALNHVMHVPPHPLDFDHWAEILNDDNWKFSNIQPYLKKMEALVDEGLLASPAAYEHGTDGPIKITRELDPRNEKYLSAFKELGHPIVDDISTQKSRLGYTEPLYANVNGLRHSSAATYLSDAKSRSNLRVVIKTTVTKILIKDGKAIGVQVTDPNGDTQVHYANKEVIVCAGTINSPKLLMLSGIGPKDHLESLGIDVVADLPVGKNFQDHPVVPILYQMEEDTSPTPAGNPEMFPVPMTVGYVALNPEENYPDYQAINLLFPHDSAGFLQLCTNVFKYSNDVCDTFYEATKGRTTYFCIIDLLMPDSRGEVLLASADPMVDPIVHTGTYRNNSDLKLMVASLKDLNKVSDTTFFKSVNASLVDTKLCTDTTTEDEFWECYAIALSSSLWHYVGTCPMGTVLDSELRVKGVKSLRVVDSSSFPTEVRGNPNVSVMTVAERAADCILKQ